MEWSFLLRRQIIEFVRVCVLTTGHGGAGVVIVDADNSTDILRRYYLYLGPNVTNNVAEYMVRPKCSAFPHTGAADCINRFLQALLTGIRSAKSLGIRTCIFKTDSELVARQGKKELISSLVICLNYHTRSSFLTQ